MKSRLMEHICSTQILVAALMGISEEVRRSEMSYYLGGLSQLNLKHTVPLISIEVGQERFTRQPGSERAEAWKSWLLENAPYTSLLKFNSRCCGVLHILPRKTRGQALPKLPQQLCQIEVPTEMDHGASCYEFGSSSVLRGALQISTTKDIA